MTDSVSQEFVRAIGDRLATRPRRQRRNDHLDAHVVPVEQAFLSVSESLQEAASHPGDHDLTELDQEVAKFMAAQFRLLAEALHWH